MHLSEPLGVAAPSYPLIPPHTNTHTHILIVIFLSLWRVLSIPITQQPTLTLTILTLNPNLTFGTKYVANTRTQTYSQQLQQLSGRGNGGRGHLLPTALLWKLSARAFSVHFPWILGKGPVLSVVQSVRNRKKCFRV